MGHPESRQDERWFDGVFYWLSRVVVPGVVLSGLISALVWKTMAPEYEAVVVFRVEQPARNVFKGDDFPYYLATQVALFTSPNVLSGVLIDPAMASRPTLQGAADKETRLKQVVRMERVPNTHLIRVVARSRYREDVAPIANTLAKSYLTYSEEFHYGGQHLKIKTLEDYARDLEREVDKGQNALLELTGRADDVGLNSGAGAPVTTERYAQFAADYDAAVTVRIKTAAELTAETERKPATEAGMARRAERIDELTVRLDADTLAEKGLLERLKTARKPDARDEARLAIARGDLQTKGKILEAVKKNLDQLRVNMKEGAGVTKLSEAREPRVPVSDHRAPVALIASGGVFLFLFGLERFRRKAGTVGE